MIEEVTQYSSSYNTDIYTERPKRDHFTFSRVIRNDYTFSFLAYIQYEDSSFRFAL